MKIHQKIQLLLIAGLSIVLFQSCLINTEPYRKTRIFDLHSKEKFDTGLIVEKFENPNMYRHSFVYRISENEIKRDEFNRWIALPENLIFTSLKTAFKSCIADNEKNCPILRGKILKFEFDEKSKNAVFQVYYSIYLNEQLLKEDYFLSQSNYSSNDPSDMSRAMSDCLDKFILKINDDIKGLTK